MPAGLRVALPRSPIYNSLQTDPKDPDGPPTADKTVPEFQLFNERRWAVLICGERSDPIPTPQ